MMLPKDFAKELGKLPPDKTYELRVGDNSRRFSIGVDGSLIPVLWAMHHYKDGMKVELVEVTS